MENSVMEKKKPILAVIGGSGLYNMPDLQEVQQFDLDTPFGKTSAPVVVGQLDGHCVAFLARHGLGHHISPSEINYRANIYALKSLGVNRIVSISACGSLREDYAPGHIIVPDQIFDFTHIRPRSFFGEGLVAHVSVADPYCPDLSATLFKALSETKASVHFGGTYITIEGPRFSTRGESNVFRSWGMSLIGMTASPEIFLAREAEICYATMAHVTDYDVWHVNEEPVTLEMVIRTLNQNTETAQIAVKHILRLLQPERPCECPSALASAIITQPESIPRATRRKLSLLVEKYLK
jgi:5'-methylthioadenosine phosphorylase